MNTLVTILVTFMVIAAVALPIIYFQIRRVFREQKNFERGLKMVPLLIHLPPPSDDTDGGGRDVRDVVDENIYQKPKFFITLSLVSLKRALKISSTASHILHLRLSGRKVLFSFTLLSRLHW